MFGYDCLYEIYNKRGFRIRYVIRKGRVVPLEVCPFSIKQLKEYTKKLKQYKL